MFARDCSEPILKIGGLFTYQTLSLATKERQPPKEIYVCMGVSMATNAFKEKKSYGESDNITASTDDIIIYGYKATVKNGELRFYDEDSTRTRSTADGDDNLPKMCAFNYDVERMSVTGQTYDSYEK